MKYFKNCNSVCTWRTDTANQRGEEWMGADKNSSRRRWRLQQDEHDFQHTSPTHYPSWPSHVATEVPLDLGTNKQPSEPKHTNTHSGNLHSLLPVLHRSDRWPVPVRPVDTAGQAGDYSSRTTNVPESLNDFSRPWNKNTPKHNLHGRKTLHKPNKTTPNRPRTDQQHQDPKTHESSSSPEANPTSDLHRSYRSRAPVRPV
jgi:hypothetical protein